MAYQLYRNTTIGESLQETVEEMLRDNLISAPLALKILLQYDKSMNSVLDGTLKSRMVFRANKLRTYRFCDSVWTFVMDGVEFREDDHVVYADRVKIVACEGKSEKRKCY